MGVQGLTSLLQRAPQCEVDLSAGAAWRRSRGRAPAPLTASSTPSSSSSSSSSHSSPPCPPALPVLPGPSHAAIRQSLEAHNSSLFLLVDGLGVFHGLSEVEPPLARVLPSYDSLHRRVVGLVCGLRLHGVELLCYFDSSSTEAFKRAEVARRSQGRLDAVRALNRHLSSATVASFHPLTSQPDVSADEELSSLSVQLLQRQVLASLSALQVAVVLCEEEADVRLSADARLYAPWVWGVLSNDSDCSVMRGVRWIPSASLVLHFVAPSSAEQRRTAVEVDEAMRRHFGRPRAQGSQRGKKPRPPSEVAAAPSSAPLFSRPSLLHLSSIRCTVWTSGSVAAALNLSSPHQLVDLALLSGNDYTKPLTPLFIHLQPRSGPRPSTPLQRWVDFLSQPAHRGQALEAIPAFAALLSQHRSLRGAVRHSRVMYEGEGHEGREEEQKGLREGEAEEKEGGEMESLTAALDGLRLSGEEVHLLRLRMAQGLCSADSLAIRVREFDLTSVHAEQMTLGEGEEDGGALSRTTADGASFRALRLPPCERVTRRLRAALALLCGRRSVVVSYTKGATYLEDAEELQYDAIAPSAFTRLLGQLSGGRSQLPLLQVPHWPLTLRCRLFTAAALNEGGGEVKGGLQEAAPLLADLPVELRLASVASHFLLHRYVDLGLSPLHVLPLIDALLAMTLTLHAVHALAAEGGVGRPGSSGPTLLVHASHDAAVFPLMLAVGLSSAYQSVLSHLSSLLLQLQSPPTFVLPLPPQRLFDGALLLSLLQSALRSSPSDVLSSSLPLAHLPPSAVDVVAVQRAVVGRSLSVSAYTAYALLHSVQRSFHHLPAMRRFACQSHAGDVDHEDTALTALHGAPPPPLRASPLSDANASASASGLEGSGGREEKVDRTKSREQHPAHASPPPRRRRKKRSSAPALSPAAPSMTSVPSPAVSVVAVSHSQRKWIKKGAAQPSS